MKEKTISLIKNHVGLILITTAAVGWIVTQQLKQKDYYFLFSYCNEINADLSRPPNRTCTEAISLENNVLTIQTKGGVKERYQVIRDTNKDYVYTFIDFVKE